jgi:TM2 domain-containing membrane protein YozV
MITGKISVDDFLRAHELHSASIKKWTNWFSAALAGCGGLMLLAGFWDLGLILLCSGICSLVVSYVSARTSLPRRMRKIYAQHKGLADEITYSWDEQYIEGKGRDGSSRRLWSDYLKMKENEHVFLLYQTDHLFEMLPKSWFQSREAILEFRKLASFRDRSDHAL